MKKIIIFALVALMVMSVSACGGKIAEAEAPAEDAMEQTEVIEEETEPAEEEQQEEDDEGLLLETIRSEILLQLNIEEPFLLDTDALLGLYGITAEQVAQSASFVTMAGTFPDEVILVEAADAAAADGIENCLQNRLNEVMVQSQTYDAENYAAAQKCRVWRNDLHVALILSPMQEEIAACYLSFFE